MRIIFDVWIGAKDVVFSVEEEILFTTIFDFVETRLMPLKEEMDNEEEAKGANPNICVMIELAKKRISFLGYSASLIEKLKSSFNENDEKILKLKFDDAFSYLN